MDVESLVGTFEKSSQEGLEQLAVAMAIPEEMTKVILEAKNQLVTKVHEDGTIETTMKIGDIERTIKYKLNEEFEHQLMTGENVKSIVKLIDGKVVEEQLTGKAAGKTVAIEKCPISSGLKLTISFAGATGTACYKKLA